MNNKDNFFLKHKLFFHIGFYIFILFLGIFLYRLTVYTYVTIQFDELRPFRERLSVYYKGYKVGRAYSIKPSKNFKFTLIKIVLYPTDLKLPKNVYAKLKREKRKRTKEDFLELEYPASPSVQFLKTGDIINGISTIDIESYFASQEPQSLDDIKRDAANTVKSLQNTVDELGKLFIMLQHVVNENEPNLKAASYNLAQTSRNLNNMTYKINVSLRQEALNNTITNLDSSTNDFRTTSKNLQIISENIDILTKSLNSTMPTINSSIIQTQEIIKNLNEITCGISHTLRKKMGGLRIFFGQAIDEDCLNDCDD